MTRNLSARLLIFIARFANMHLKNPDFCGTFVGQNEKSLATFVFKNRAQSPLFLNFSILWDKCGTKIGRFCGTKWFCGTKIWPFGHFSPTFEKIFGQKCPTNVPHFLRKTGDFGAFLTLKWPFLPIFSPFLKMSHKCPTFLATFPLFFFI